MASGQLEEVRDVTDGVWIWRVRHPGWTSDSAWEPVVTATCVESNGEVALLDPIAPPDDADRFWDRLDATPPTLLIVLKPDHVRDVDRFADRYEARAFGPFLFWGGDAPEHELEPLEPDMCLPGDIQTRYDGRWRHETPLWIPARRLLVFADALTERAGELRVWRTPWHEERVLPALRTLLDLPFEHVIVSHGEPVHDRREFERALERPPWPEQPGGDESPNSE